MRLLRVELVRFFSRNLVRIGMLGVLGVVAMALVGTWNDSKPMSESELAFAKESYDSAVADWEINGEEYTATCLADEALAQETDPKADYGCEGWEPRWENWVGEDLTFATSAESLLPSITFVFVAFAFAVGVSFIAAEITTGAIGNWLTFEPRRMRVLGSKVAAAAVGVVPAVLVGSLVLVGGAYAIYSMRGQLGDPTGELWGTLAGMTGRLTLLGVGFAVLGVAFGTLVRHTAAALGIAFGYLVVIEMILSRMVDWVKPYLLMVNIDAVAQDGSFYSTLDCEITAAGESCLWVDHDVSLTHGAVVLLVLLVVATVGAFAVFRRRDVS